VEEDQHPQVRGEGVRKAAMAKGRPAVQTTPSKPVTPTRILAMEKQRRALELSRSPNTSGTQMPAGHARPSSGPWNPSPRKRPRNFGR
jgi:hypothetical protein